MRGAANRLAVVGLTLLGVGTVPAAAQDANYRTRSMLLRYNIVAEGETAAALLSADAYLSYRREPKTKRDSWLLR